MRNFDADMLVDWYYPEDHSSFAEEGHSDRSYYYSQNLPIGKVKEFTGIANEMRTLTVVKANGKTEERLFPIPMTVKCEIKSITEIADATEPYGQALYILLTDGTLIKRSRAAGNESKRQYRLAPGEYIKGGLGTELPERPQA